ncbi:glycosyltransferase family 2 protein [Actinoplanes sp. NPDC049118]|uniref:glycosyltransferase family 2 protein n=1 Tax=Actinoplanes sp. NPDC049118 TaxID=3155769 RepID=UPI003402465E
MTTTARRGTASRKPAAAPSMTVVICCYTNQRWAEMRAACAAVRRQLAAGDELVVVVDHNDDLFRRAAGALTDARVLRSQGPRGLSAARNTGVRAATGDVVVFLDDDAEPRAGWLDGLREVFGEPDVAVAGTTVTPRWEGGTAPAWFPVEFGWVVGCSYRGQPTRRSEVRNPIGASMAVRRAVFAKAGGFSEAMGRVGTLPVGCEETEFCIRAARARPGDRVVLEPDAYVDHFVPVARQTVGYFVRRCYHEGRSKYAVAQLSGHRAAFATERRYVRAVLPAGVLRGVREGLRQPYALLRSGAIVLGLAATVTGLVAGRMRAVAR